MTDTHRTAPCSCSTTRSPSARRARTCGCRRSAAQVRERGVLATAETRARRRPHAGWLVVHVRLAFDPTYTLRTNRLPRFDAYPDQRAMLADSPEAQIVDALARRRRRARRRQGLRRPVRRHPAA